MSTPESPESTRTVTLNWKTAATVLSILVAALTQAGVVPVAAGTAPPSAPPCTPCDGSFQQDVRASLDRLSSSMTDIRERLARLEGPNR